MNEAVAGSVDSSPLSVVSVLACFVLFTLAVAPPAYLLSRPTYQSTALIRRYNVVTLDNKTVFQPEFFDAQADAIKSPAILNAAMNTPVWKANGDNRSQKSFANNTEARRVDSSIKVSFRDVNPAIANAAIQAICDGYASVYRTNVPAITTQYRQGIDKENQVRESFKLVEDQIEKLGNEFGTSDLSSICDAAQKKLTAIERSIAEASENASPSLMKRAELQRAELIKLDQRRSEITVLLSQRELFLKDLVQIKNRNYELWMIREFRPMFTFEPANRLTSAPVIDNRRRNAIAAAGVAVLVYFPLLYTAKAWRRHRQALRTNASFPVIFKSKIPQPVLPLNHKLDGTSSAAPDP